MTAVPDIDVEKLDATTEDDIRRYKAEEGYGADFRPAGTIRNVPAASELRGRLGLTQEAFAKLLRIPVGTLRNWEQGRKMPDPAAQTLLFLVAANPADATKILSGTADFAENINQILDYGIVTTGHHFERMIANLANPIDQEINSALLIPATA